MSTGLGITDSHSVITPRCGKRPDEDVKADTLENVDESLTALLDIWGDHPNARIHVLVCVERNPD